MARSVTFNGITSYRPGGLTRVNANALNQIGLSTNGIIGVVGESEGGVPSVVATLDDPALAKESFRNGPLADAMRIIFDPSSDPRVPAGAFRCYCIRTNQGTQASRTLYNQVSTDTVAAASTTTVINLTTGGLVVDALIGNMIRINNEDREVDSNTATSITVTTAFSAVPTVGTSIVILAPMLTVTSRDYGSHTNQIQFEYEPGVSSGQAWTTLFDNKSQVSDDIGGKSYLQLEYVGQSTAVTQASGTTDGAGSTTQIADSAASFGTFTNFFVEVDTAGALAETNLRKIASNAGTTIDVTNEFKSGGLATAPGTGSGYTVKTGVIREGTLAVDAPTSSTVTLETTLDIAANELAGMIFVSGTQRRVIASHTAGTGITLTLAEATQDDLTAGASYEIRYATQASATIGGANGVATTLTTTVSANGVTAATDLNITFTPNQTLGELVDAINAEADYTATVPSGINRQTTLCKNFDFDSAHTDVELRNDKAAVTSAPSWTANVPVAWPNNFRQDLQAVINSLNSINETVSAARVTTTATGAGAGRPEFTGGSVGSVGDNFLYLTGGTRGISANSNWQAAWDELLKYRCNFVVPLIAYDLADDGYGSTATHASVVAQMQAHIGQANGVGKSERGGFAGKQGTQAQIIQLANQLNDADIQLTCQKHRVLDVDGNLATQPEWISAVIACGMRAGMPEVGEPLTHKFIRTFEMTQDSSWDPGERTDANIFIQNGILFAETIRGKGTRWVRDLTTYIIDDNLAYAEGSVRDVVRYVSYGLRTLLEDRFTGVKASPANAGAMKDTAAEFLELMRSNNIIVDSTDSEGNFVKAYHNLRVTISGDIATIRVGCFPVVGINFQLNDIYLQLPSQAA